MILDEEQVIELVRKEGKIKFSEREKAFEEFIKEFNKEAEKQNSKWFAEVQNKDDKRKEYHFLHISKIIETGWWIFKEKTKISFHLSYGGYYYFVDNDYAVSEYSEKQNKTIIDILPEFKQILENIPLPVHILYDYSRETFNRELNDINKRIEELETII